MPKNNSTSVDIEAAKLCRICLKRSNKKDDPSIITPCNCSAPFNYAHKQCLNHHLETTQHEYCDICRFKYIMSKRQQSICKWFSDVAHDERLELYLLIIATILIFWICVIAVIACFGAKGKLHVAFIYLLISITILIVLLLVIIWIIFTITALKDYNKWTENNFKISVEQNPNYNPPQHSRSPSHSPVKASGLHQQSSPPLSSN